MAERLILHVYVLCVLLTSSSGSFFKSSERSISRVKGGRSAEAAALAWSKDRVAPESTTYTNWLKSTIDNPAVLEYEVRQCDIQGCL